MKNAILHYFHLHHHRSFGMISLIMFPHISHLHHTTQTVDTLPPNQRASMDYKRHLYLATAQLPLMGLRAGDSLTAFFLSLLNKKPSPHTESLHKIVENQQHFIQHYEAIHRQQQQLLEQGVRRFQSTPYQRTATPHTVIWQEGSSRLLAFNPANTTHFPTLCFIPSLINTSYIFDLTPQKSMISFMISEGFPCIMMDWGAPTTTEHAFSLDDYIFRLERALIVTQKKQSILVGYCMGGLITLALAQRKIYPHLLGVALIATPWDFNAPDITTPPNLTSLAPILEHSIQQQTIISGDDIYQWLYAINPWAVHDKFIRFATLDDHDAIDDFMAREQWVQDSIALTSKVANQCFIAWAVHNHTAKQLWKVAEEVINPTSLSCPAFIAIGKYDSVVPMGCAQPLTQALPSAVATYSPSGHVGMIAGSNAPNTVWQPLAIWAKGITHT